MSGGPILSPQGAAARMLSALKRPSHILVAISGGSDSTGLLVALASEIKAQGLPHKLSAVTIDHDLRPGSAAEAASVSELCARLAIAHVTRRWQGEKPGSGIMAAAREARYERLADVASEVGADLVVTGHTFDDQQETLAMRSARLSDNATASTTGIADAVLFDRRIWVLRPFLSCLRRDIRAYLVSQDIGWIDDPSNADLHYERVRIRADLADRGPVDPDPAALADGVHTRSALSLAAANWVERFFTVDAGVLGRIDPGGIDAAAPAFGYGLSCLAAVFGGQAFGPGQDSMLRIRDFIGRGEPGRRTAGGVVFDLRRNGLYLMRESRNIAALHLAPGTWGVWDGRFDVSNDGADAVEIVAAEASAPLAFAAGTPKGAALRAAASAPSARPIGGTRHQGRLDLRFTPRFAPFDRFLTRIDVTLANHVAVAFGRTAYLPPPL